VMDVSHTLWEFVDRVLEREEDDTQNNTQNDTTATMTPATAVRERRDAARRTFEYHLLHEALQQRAVMLMSYAAVWPRGEVDGWSHYISSTTTIDPEMHGALRYDDATETYVFDDINVLFRWLQEMYKGAGRESAFYRDLYLKVSRFARTIEGFIESDRQSDEEKEAEEEECDEGRW